jgi:hypothetical protein
MEMESVMWPVMEISQLFKLMLFNFTVPSFCNMYVGQEMEWCDAKEVHVLPFHHLNGRWINPNDSLSFRPWYWSTSWPLLLGQHHHLPESPDNTWQNNLLSPTHICFLQHSCDPQECPFVLESSPTISQSYSPSCIVTDCGFFVVQYDLTLTVLSSIDVVYVVNDVDILVFVADWDSLTKKWLFAVRSLFVATVRVKSELDARGVVCGSTTDGPHVTRVWGEYPDMGSTV